MVGCRLVPRTRLPSAVLIEAECSERHALVEPHVVGNLARLADYHARAMIDEESRADASARMDVDSRAGVSPLGHQARDERHSQLMQLVRQAIVQNGLEPRDSSR